MSDTPSLTPDQALERLNGLQEFAKNHPEEWKNQLAKDLNHIMGRAIWWLETDRDEIDAEFGAAVVRVVERVAEFEELQTVDHAPVIITTDRTYGLSRKMLKVKEALRAYHNALDTRKNGNVAALNLAAEIGEALGTPWVQGATLTEGKS